MSSLQQRIAGLSADRLADLVRRMQERKVAELEPAEPDIPRRPQSLDPAPLSFAQQRLWFLDRLQPGEPVYNIAAAVDVRGELAPALLAAALRGVVCRHEILRSLFWSQPEGPVQRARPDVAVAMPVIDLGGLPDTARAREADLLSLATARQPFDLTAQIPLVTRLLRLAEGEHVLLLVMHHIAADGWSTGVLVREVAALYEAGLGCTEARLSKLPIQYADYAVWQRQRLQGKRLEESVAWWRGQLAGSPALALPADRPGARRDTLGGRQPLTVPAERLASLRQLCQREGVTLFTALLALLDVLLCRTTDQEDIAVGTPVANRTHPQAEGLIGFFANTLVLRTRLSAEAPFRALLARVGSVVAEAFQHQEAPFEKLVEELEPERVLGRNPLFQVMLAFQGAAPRYELPGCALQVRELATGTAKLDLLLALTEHAGTLHGFFEYSRALFDAESVGRLSGSFLSLLASVCAQPEGRLSACSLLGEGERHQLLVEWNDTRSGVPSAGTLHGLFERQALRTPGAPAVVWGESELSYAELDRQAGALARRLVGLGVGVESPVGICLERTPTLLVGLLGVLKAGGAYVPLDPAYPRERLAFLVEDSGARLVLTQGDLEERLPSTVGRVLLDDGPGSRVAGEAVTVRPSEVLGGTLAYVIYTSGSTGRPKGVGIEHRSAVGFLGWVGRSFTAEEMSGVLAATSICFDLSIFELFGPLSCGGTVVLAADALALPGLPAAGRVRLLNTVPSAAAELVRSNGLPASLRTINLAGEPLPGALVDRLTAGRELRVLNLYGPSEDTTYSSWSRGEPGGREPTIGRPLDDTRVYLLDGGLRPVPLGVRGELCLGSASLARGYLGRPELTAERFVPDPFGGELGARLYRTGDLSRHLPSGEIDFLGRLDHQVKIRGFRIELGEIETALLALPGVREGVVLAAEQSEQKRLVAYVVLEEWEGGETGVSRLRAGLAERLPGYMVPSLLVRVESLPRTPNGKVDRRALPALTELCGPEAGVYAAARTPTEDLLAVIWGQLLGVERIGRGDGFFALGGHSLLAVQALARVREAFGVDLPVRALFDEPTLGGLAERIEAAQRSGATVDGPPLVRVLWNGRRRPLSFAQERLWFLSRLQPELDATYNLPLAVRLEGEVDPRLVAASLQRLVARHEALRTSFAEVDGSPVQVVASALDTPLPVIDLGGLPAAERQGEASRLTRSEAARPFDLGRGPLLRASWVSLSWAPPKEQLLLLTLHHIVSDGWSLGVLAGELSAGYAALAQGVEPSLPALPIQPADHAAWQRQWIAGESRERLLAARGRRLSGTPRLLLQVGRAPAAPAGAGARLTVPLPFPLVERLVRCGRERSATPFMTLLAAFQALLGRFTGQEDLAVGTPVANRDSAATRDLIGLFVNTLVLRTSLGGEPSFAELVRRVREVFLDGYEHREMPFEKLVEELAPERDAGSNPLFQVMFVLQSPLPSLRLGEARSSVLDIDPGVARLDLTLALAEVEGVWLASWEYRRSVLDAESVGRLSGSFLSLLASVCAQPEGRLSACSLLGEGERHQLLVEWNDTRSGAPSAGTLHGLFERQALRTPGAPAVVWGESELSYAELDRQAGALARRLVGLGVGVESPVGICLERTPTLLVGLLGVLKAGGAYVPLDPAYPRERLAFLVEDSGARLVLTQGDLEERLPSTVGRVLLDDGPGSRVAGEAVTVRPSEVLGGTLAYVIYTSGSTGRPKGVGIEHRSAVGFLGWVGRSFTAEEMSGVLAATSICFDLSIFELFGPLSCGGTVVLAADALALPGLPAAGRVRLLNTVPSAAAELVRSNGLPASLRTINLAGEPLPGALVDRLTAGRELRVLNLYGPSEDTTYSSWSRGEPGGREPTIGRPLDDTRVYLLDGGLRPVPLGVRGELCLGSASLARGYLGRPELTAERFVPDPFGGELGARLYRTGDLSRHLPSGEIDFLGRLDHQVKIRGFRIELGEIETALLALPGVREGVVLAAEQSEQKRLVAYVVLEEWEGGETGVSRLRAGLAERLPGYMVPSLLVRVESLPRTPNGKVDRRALPALTELCGPEAGVYAAARTPTEDLLAVIWGQLLGVERIGRGDGFFALGGHSLLAVQALARVREAFGVDLPVRALFDEPTLGGLAERIEAAQRSGATVDGPPLVRVLWNGRRRPLSFAQERLWFLSRLQPELDATYNLPLAVRLEGEVDPRLVAASLQRLVARHEALRTSFAEVDGSPVQVVVPALDTPLPVIDLGGLPAAERQGEASRLTRSEAARPFDLGRGPLLRASWVSLSWDLPKEQLLLLTLHHIVSDGWSLGVLAGELSAGYAALAQGVEPSLPALPIQPADHAAWQRQWIAGESRERLLAARGRRLSGTPRLLLQVGRAPAAPAGAGARLTVPLPFPLVERLVRCGRERSATPFMTLLAAFQALLGRFTGQEDLAVGTPVANRDSAATRDLIGLFVNTLVLRTSLGGEPSFAELVRRVREVFLDGYEHREMPFEKLVEELAPERDAGSNPLFQVMFVLQSPLPSLRLGEARSSVLDIDPGVARLDLTLALAEVEGVWLASWEYRRSVLDAESVGRLSGSFLSLLASVCAQPEGRLSACSLLGEGERHQLLVEWNDTRSGAPSAGTLHGLFERQALRTPGAPAVVWGESELSYAELDRQAGALARRLVGLGVGAESPVGICLERTPTLLVGLLGVLKAGGAYVPLDPAYPRERLAFLVEDSGARLVLTQGDLEERLPSTVGRVLLDDGPGSRVAGEAVTVRPSEVLGGTLAYVIYTSGSTGRPKGVGIEHRSAVGFLGWVGRSFTAEEMSGVLAATSICFDLSIFELFGPLSCGGTVVLAADALALPGLPAAGRVRLLNTVPSAAAELVRSNGLPASLRTINLAGEPLPGALVDRLTAGRELRVLNLYGPSEDTTYSSWSRGEPGGREPTIGRPLDDTRVYLLDGGLRPVPLGVRGELCLGSASLARGYLGRPELTAERFVPDPFGGELGARLYRTGDLSRHLPSGEIDFLGRLDHQVKIRGFRIELGEIETALLALPGVREGVVLAAEQSEQKRLVAYVVLEEWEGGETGVSRLRAGLAERLPGYMVPSLLVRVESLPRTPNGKVDRRALPALTELCGPEAGVYAAARTPTEDLLAVIWGQLLGVERIGRGDGFFALGGHSLLAVQALARVREAFGVDLPVRALFDEPTLGGLAERIEAAQRSGATVDGPPLVRVLWNGRRRPLSFAQERLWFLSRLQPELDATYNLPLAVRLEGEVDPRLVAASLQRLVARHEALRTSFAEVDGSPVQVVVPALDTPLPVIDLGGLPAAERQGEASRLTRSEAARPFDLGRGPLLRASWVSLSWDLPKEQLLLLTLHHIVSDGWSLGVLAGELSAGYAALAQGVEPSLPALPIQPADHAAWQRQWIAGESRERLLAARGRRLSGTPRLLLQVGRAPAAPAGAGARLTVPLPFPLVERLVRCGRERSATPFMTLLAAFQALLGRFTGQEDLAVGTPVANRDSAATRDLIGLFVNTLVLRTSLGGEPSFAELVRRVREVFLDGYEHREMPFEKLVEELAPERDAGSNPLFQVMFVLQSPLPSLRLGEARSSVLDIDPGVARLDLTLALAEVEGVWLASWEYRRSVLDAESVGRLSGSFLSLLASVCAQPEGRLSACSLLGEGERHQLLVEWNDTRSGAPSAGTLHGLFERQALRTPGAPAVVWGESELSYAELDRQAGALARRLVGLGVGAESPVGICLERTPTLLVGLLGVLKAGGAYVPLDPAYPRERLAFLVEDSGARLVLTQGDLEERLPSTVGRVLLDDGPGSRVAGEAVTVRPSEVLGGTLAYVIYTSGSTGRPKGVGIEHRSAVGFLGWVGRSFTAEEMSGVLAATSICFDLSIFELFGPLSCGGTVVLAADALALPGLPAAGRVRLLNTVPSAAAELVRSNGLPASLRTINLAGEPLPGALVDRLTAGRELRVLNLYGPSEDTTYSSWSRGEPGGREPTIGRPLDDTRVYLLDGGLRPVPLGVRGELCLGSASLARGYLGRPELTAERFVPDPFGGELGARLYRTGDLSRHLPSGEIDFLGRLDHQVKIRGFRIELGEIETALLALPGVREGVVLAAEQSEQKRLVAYVVLEEWEGGETGVSRLRAGLAERLPGYMVPSLLVRVESLPRTPNGKVDRRALPALTELCGPEAGVYAAARTPTEDLLAVIWGQLLGVERIGRGDGFFALGGHSLLAVQALARVREAFGVDLPVRALFDEPTLGGLAERIEAAQRSGATVDGPPLVRVLWNGRRRPLSFAQERLWFLSRLQPELDATYNLPLAVRLEGEVDPRLVAASLQRLVARHEALRTSFAEVDGSPVQVVVPALDTPLPVIDLGGLPAAERQGEASRLTRSEAARPFDLGRGPLLRASWVSLSWDLPKEQLLLLTLHHIVSDGWSLGVLAGELSAGYAALAQGVEPSLPALPIQPADHAAWQRQWIAGESRERLLAARGQRLSGTPRLLLQVGRAPAAPAGAGARLTVPLPFPLVERLVRCGRERSATPFMTLLAAFQALLGRFTGQEDLAVGTPVANRDSAATRDLIGLFVNTLVLRTSLGGEPSFAELVRRVREVFLDGYEHREMPFEKLVEELAPERDAGSNPLFQVMFVLQSPLPSLRLGEARSSVLDIDPGVARLDLTLALAEVEGVWLASWEYRRSVLDAESVGRLSGSFLSLLASVCAQPEGRLSACSLLGEGERHQLLVEWNDTRSGVPSAGTLHGLFERQALRTPGAPAVVWGESELSYAELDRQAGALARRLVGLGVGVESPVGICLERTPTLLVGLLGVLKAGGAYVPLDPAYPRERLAFLVEDSGARLVLTQGDLEERLPSTVGRVLLDDGPGSRVAGEAVTVRPSEVLGGTLAYVIYTSGSTGRPKGVGIEHRSAVGFLGWVGRSFTAEEMSGVLAATSICFDLSIFELFGPLSCGGTVVLAADALALPGLPAAGRVRLLNTVPSAAAELVRSNGLPASLRTINLAGEPLPGALVDRLTAGRELRVLNLYGPSEDTTYSSWSRGEPGGREPTIGRPLDDTRVYLLDGGLRPVPLGVRGELCLGSASLARGYLGRPELTAERFVPDPFGGELGARLYRTGDLSRHLPSGEIDFLGRLDHQVKIRGFRIELGEIETALLALPGVREGVVLAAEQSEQKRLVAYVVLEEWEGGETGVSRLRAGLAERLPGYMVPSLLVRVESLPRTPNGKVDRRALPALTELCGPEAGVYAAARTPTEDLLAVIWGQLLGVERIGRGDGFFALGGHSLLAVQALARVREAFGVDLPVRALFDEPTLGGLAERIEAAQRSGATVDGPPLVRVLWNGRRRPLSFAQERLWFLEQLDPDVSAYVVPLALRLAGALDSAALAGALVALAVRHETLRTRFASEGAEVWQQVDLTVPELALADLGGLSPAVREVELLRLVRAEAQRGFDLARGPLLRVALLSLGKADHALLLTLHHAISDAWSLGVLLRELGIFYEAARSGRPSPLPPLAIQYGDYAEWQRRRMSCSALEAHLEYFREKLQGLPPEIELPFDRPRLEAPRRRGAQRHWGVSSTITAELRALGQREGATLFMILLAAFSALLGRHAGREDVVVGAPVAHRTRREVEGLIGFFANTLVLRVDLGGDPFFAGLLARARETALGAYAHQDLPFERLVEELAPERNRSRPPVVQVLLAFQNVPFDLGLPAVQALPLPAPDRVAKVDLTLTVAETGDGLAGSLEYDPDLFDATTVERFLARLSTLLVGIGVGAERPLSELPCLTEAERHHLFHECNDTRSAFPRESSLDRELAAQATRTPDAVALLWRDGLLSYRELDATVGRLAARLHAAGVGPEARVGLFVERSPEAIVGMVAILRAGAVYVPLDPAYPKERLALLLTAARIEVLLTREDLIDRLPPTSAKVVPFSLEAGEGGPSVPVGSAGGDRLAYIMFTSGSTGQPKGVMVSHANVLRLVYGSEYVQMGKGEVFLQFAPNSFDAATLEIWGSLLSGGCLAIPAPGLLSLAELGDVIARFGVTGLWLTAGLFQRMVEENLAGLAPVRQLLAGGDVVSAVHASRVLATFPDCRLTNGYGPTESTTFACCHRITPADAAGSSIPIGRPIPNTRAQTVGPRMEPAPSGAPAELAIGGEGLARGYLDDPARTAERFVPDPLSGELGARLYRTGDQVRQLPDGRLLFLGRLDRQVKIRGFRVEPGEIEAALSHHPDLADCAVDVRPDSTGDRRLVAWAVPVPEKRVSAASLQAFLAALLPAPLVPATFVTVPVLPLDPNGKVDRHALPEPEETSGPQTGAAGAPDPLTELLAGLFADALGRERVEVGESFFDLGGHSLMAMRLVARVRQKLAVELPIADLFAAPTPALLARRVAVHAGGRGPDPPIVPGHRTGDLPLSFAQQRLWLLDRLEPDNPAYNLPVASRLVGRLSPRALARALEEIVRRHEALRTALPAKDGVPVQCVLPAAPVPLPLIDLSALPEDVRDAVAQRLAAAEALRPFDLEAGPLLRAALLRLTGGEHLLILTLHHVATDGWSMGILFRELAAFYEAAAAGRPAALPELPVQYADYAIWQRRHLAGGRLDEELAYWRERLAGVPSRLELPTDRPRPAVLSSHGGTVRAAIPETVARPAADLGRREGCTLFMVFLAAFAALLQRWAGQDDLLVGAPAANRGRSETEGLIGFFANTLVLRLDLGDDPDVLDLLARARETVLGAWAHQELPFERLVEELRPERARSHAPLVQVVLAQPPLLPVLELPGLRLLPVPVAAAAKFDLTLSVSEATGGGLNGLLEYNADLFVPTTLARFLAQFEAMLAGMAEAPGRQISGIPLLGEAERQQLLVEWNDPASEVDVSDTLYQVFAARARRSPSAIAASLEGDQLTFAELEERANRLAHRLLALGIGPDVPVALCLERSLDLVVAILGVIEVGGAYVPLDPAYPVDRIAFMLEDSGARVVVTRGNLLDRLRTEVTSLCLDRDAGRIAAESAAPLPVRVGPRNLAYVIYTSGSSGRPKGVLVEHAQVMRLFFSTEDLFRFEASDVWTLFHSYAFDFSVWELWGSLLYGGRLVLVPYLVSRSPEDFYALVARERVTVLNQTPSAFRQLLAVEDGVSERDLALRLVIFGGEALELQGLRPWLERHGDLLPRLVNMYGITETTVHVTWRPVGLADVEARRGSVIGVPLSDLQAYVLDADGRPLPIGVPGEMYVGGGGVSRGYLGRPALTAERFLPDSFALRPGRRLYRTGDLARWLPEGELEYLGRIDHQVKIRGFRIELGEIESTIVGHPQIREAVVLLLPEPGEEGARLVAYAVPAAGAVPGVQALRSFLRESLPEHMVPAFLVLVDALPLTPNGKLDRRALPAPDVGKLRVARVARDSVEEALAELWAEVLGIDGVGIDEGFFDLGGHSLLATRLISRVRSVFRVELPLSAVFEAPTVAGMAAEVVRALRGGKELATAPLRPVSRYGSLPASFAQERFWLLDRLNPGSPAYNLRVALRLGGDLDAAALAGTLNTLVVRHEALRTTFDEVDGAPVQVIAPAAELTLPVVNLATLPEPRREAEALRLGDEHAEQRFDLRRGPLVSALLLGLGERESVLAFVLHHSIGDGWSLGVLCRELMAIYRDLCSGVPVSLPPLSVQYADYAVWQRDGSQAAALEAQLAWWRRQLDGPLPPLALPVRQRYSAVRGQRGAACRFALAEELAGALKTLARGHGATLSIVLLAGFQALLHRITGGEDLRVGTPVAGRTHLETEGLIGCFLNTLVTRVDLSGDPTFRELLGRVRSAVLAAHAHQDVPYERLAQELASSRDPAQPLFHALFLLHNFPLPPLRLPGLSVQPFATERRVALADLALELEERDGEGIAAVLAYDEDLFDRVTVEGMAEGYRVLLQEMAAAPDVPISAPGFIAAPAPEMASRLDLEAW